MQTEIKTTDYLSMKVRPTEEGVEIDTWPAGVVSLDLKGIDLLVDTLQARAAKIRASEPTGQGDLFKEPR